MSDFPLWGSPAGELAYDDNLRRNLLTSANFQHINTQTDVAQQQLMNERAMGALMRQGMGAGPTGQATPGASPDDLGATASQPTLGERFGRIARLAADAGLVKQADEFGKTSSLMLAREASVKLRNARANIAQFEEVKKEAELIGQFMGDVQDEDGWNRANAMYAFQTGKESPYSQLSYDPRIVEQIRTGAITAAKKADQAIAEHRQQADADYKRDRLAQQDTQNRLRERNQQVREDREARLAKGTGNNKPIIAPKVMSEQAKKMIKRDYPEMADSMGDAPEAIASEAARLMRQNAALDQNTALGQAYAAAVKSGDFQTSDGYGGTNIGKKTTFVGQGRTEQTAMRLPADRKGLVEGRFYTNDKGQTAQWKGGKFVVGAPALSANNTRPLPSDTENDDEDDSED